MLARMSLSRWIEEFVQCKQGIESSGTALLSIYGPKASEMSAQRAGRSVGRGTYRVRGLRRCSATSTAPV